MAKPTYQPKEFELSGLKGISDETVEMHLGLYQGYVKNTNLLTEQIKELAQKKKPSGSDPLYAELTRRLGFEYGGMVLHEYYFENLAANGKGEPGQDIKQAMTESFGSLEKWQEDFAAIGGMRGVGWAILYQDPATKQLSNLWIEFHQDGVPSSFKPILVMDVWEHAFLLDYKPAQRSQYIEAFFSNIDWNVINARLANPAAVRAAA